MRGILARPPARYYKLRRKRSANNSVSDGYLKRMVAIQTLNPFFLHLSESGTGGNMDLLFNSASWAFHRHHNVTLVGNRSYLLSHSGAASRSADTKTTPVQRGAWQLLLGLALTLRPNELLKIYFLAGDNRQPADRAWGYLNQ